MPDYHLISIPYETNTGESDVFAKTALPFTAESLGKTSRAAAKDRQNHFETQLLRMRDHLSSNRLPVFVNWDGLRRMDKGCIGHSQARGFLRQVENGPNGYVEYVDVA